MDVQNIDVGRLKILDLRLAGFRTRSSENRQELVRVQSDRQNCANDIFRAEHTSGSTTAQIARLKQELEYFDSECVRLNREYREITEQSTGLLQLRGACEEFLNINKIRRDNDPRGTSTTGRAEIWK